MQMCCHEKDAPEKETKKCHVPWAQLEHLKQPASWKSRHTDDVPPPYMWPDDEDFKLCVKYTQTTLVNLAKVCVVCCVDGVERCLCKR